MVILVVQLFTLDRAEPPGRIDEALPSLALSSGAPLNDVGTDDRGPGFFGPIGSAN
jgi:hypothetical protein